ncbi:MAG: alpha/beta hydrolase [Candidatus Limnocylindrales bacterium]
MQSIEDAFVGKYRVCDYDRADPPEARREAVVNELAALLEVAAVPGPYVLVGQSVGGDIAWLYANRYPDEVAGFISMNPGPFRLDREVMEKVWTPDEMAAEFPEAGSPRDIDSRIVQSADPPPGITYVVMLSTIAQCGNPTDICGRFYPAYEAWGREVASRTTQGRFVQVQAGHEILATHLPEVVAAIEGLLEPAPSGSALPSL